MLFGHNTNVKAGTTTYHVQTEDRGTANALIDTTVYCGGRVLHRRTNNYFDLLPLDPSRQEILKKRIAEQHGAVAEEIRNGSLHLAAPPAAAQIAAMPSDSKTRAASSLALELINERSWLKGKRASLHVGVRKSKNGEAIPGALVTARIDGAAEVSEHSTETGADGHARLHFEMPRVQGGEPALVIEATQADSRGQLKFVLRPKPRVPEA